MKYLTLNNIKIPAIGFGTFQVSGQDASLLTAYALENGYRHIDTAQIYKNEEQVGDGILSSGIPREDIFLTTKIWVDCFKADALIQSVQDSLEKLKTDYVDLILLHWPNEKIPLDETILGLNEVYQKRFANYIGVSNFTIKQMEAASRLSQIPISFNQIEYHPYLTQDNLVKRAKELKINIMAHSSIGHEALLKNAILQTLAEKYKKDVVQIILRWLYELNIPSLTKSSKKDRILSNASIFDFQLSEKDMNLIKSLSSTAKRFINPEGLSPVWD
ncbi:aldo/keto reductase [Legionella sp. CNM-1927-20]|uniref:aldo/keto reductase n=1 Tax=Legionella sp. CNM-1927-20 TaxID=3422221 RepID=UPI00403B0EA3